MTRKVKSLTGGARKREFRLELATAISPVEGWSGGSGEWHSLVAYKPGLVAPQLECGNEFNKLAVKQDLQPGCVLVTTSVFCGKPMRPTITCRPEEEGDVLKWLAD